MTTKEFPATRRKAPARRENERGSSGRGHLSTEELRERVAAMTRAGRTAREIAERLDVTTRTVHRHRSAAGVAKEPVARISPDTLAHIERLLDDGCSRREVARTVGVSTWAIKHHFPGRGWDSRQVAEWASFINRINSNPALQGRAA